jgi:hypothetical protein
LGIIEDILNYKINFHCPSDDHFLSEFVLWNNKLLNSDESVVEAGQMYDF